jgi:hypothetical protein
VQQVSRSVFLQGILIANTAEEKPLPRADETIRPDHHQIKSYHLNKIGLSSYDDKRYMLGNGCDMLVYGHYRINSSS